MVKGTDKSHYTSIKIFSANVQSILNKLMELEVIVAEQNFSVLCFCEHWCSLETKVLAVLPGFVCASMFCRTQQSHGGAAIFIREGQDHSVIDLTDLCVERHFEIVGVVVKFSDWSIICISLYRVPNGDKDVFFNNFERLWLRLSRMNYPIVVFGDVNLDVSVSDAATARFLNLLRSLDSFCANSLPTRGNAVLDNVISNLPRNSVNVTVLQPPISDHCALVTTISKLIPVSQKSKPVEREIRIFSKPNQDMFFTNLISTDWNCVLSTSNEDKKFAFDFFFEKFLNNMDLCFPLKTVKNRPKSLVKKFRPSKETLALKEEVRRRYGFYQWALKYNIYIAETKTNYIAARKNYKQALRKAYLDFNCSYISSAPNSCKAAWEVINSRSGKSSSEKVNHNLSPDDFNKTFLSSVKAVSDHVLSSSVTSEQLLHNHNIPNQRFRWSVLSCEDVQKCVLALKSSHSKDIYSINSDLVKKVLPAILEPLTMCINLCLATGYFPNLLKLSKVVPIFKKGNPALAESYRPISLVPIFSKIIEKAVIHQVSEFFEANSLFSKFQFGFRRGLSTVDAVEALVTDVLDGFEKHHSTVAALCDLTKAFDCVPHDILLRKLEYYGIMGVELEFFKSYLTNRTQKVFANHNFSKTMTVESGVPQGSVLGPFLFLVLVNDLPCNVSCSSVIFADDSTFFSSGKDIQMLILQMNNYLKESYSWFNANGLLQNNDKTQNIVFTLSKQFVPSNNLKLQSNVKLLGITLDPNLSWASHVSGICIRLSRVLFLLNHLKKYVPKSYLRMAYFSFFHSLITYGITLWGNGQDVNSVLLLQKRAVRIITGSHFLENCRPLFVQESILTVPNQYIYSCLIRVKQSINTCQLRSDVHTYFTRQSSMIDEPFCRLSRSQKNFSSLGLRLFNKLPICSHNVSFKIFKSVIHSWLLKNPFYSVSEFLNTPVNIKF